MACRVDNSGLAVGEMPVLPHGDASVNDVPMGVAGEGVPAGGNGGGGSAATTGAAGDGTAGAAGLGGPGAAGDQGAAGTSGGAGNTGAAGTSGGAGNTGAAGVQGAAGTSGSAGDVGAAGSTGIAGTTGAAGMGAAGTTGTAGMGAAGTGAAGTGAAGMSVPPCGPDTCKAGCCDAAGKCVAGRALDRCGNGGGACGACGRCQLCNDSGVCDVDPSSTWSVICAQATVAQTQPNGMTWDLHTAGPDGIAPDPFCQFEMPSNSLTNAKVSPTLADTYTPVWNFDITPNAKPIKAADLMSSSKTWRLWIGDDDGCGVKGCVGQELCEINQPLTAGQLLAGQLVQKNLASCVSLTVKFVCSAN